ncbi:hypothetical protein N0A02_17880 [Paraburkholderia acidicola]|uniref:Uncharacterized protein n=1 Tax=Paraburkholderia acidicola TaxID=1912599 RepID=A0ABV1LQ65_9BURK
MSATQRFIVESFVIFGCPYLADTHGLLQALVGSIAVSSVKRIARGCGMS